jgi:hypothetical protein
MPWIRIDDHYDEHPKFARAGPLGVVMWLAGLAYCNRNLTDGFIPWTVAQRLVSWQFLAPRADDDRELVWSVSVGTGMHGEDVDCEYVIGLLLDASLWTETSGGYRVHDYSDFQPTKAQVVAERAAKAAAGRAGGIAAAAARATAGAVAKSKPVPVPNPVPEEDSPLPLKEGKRANGTNPRATGTNPRATGTSPRQEREAQKRGPSALHEILSSIQKGPA